jgi:hypothetical protein
LLAKHGISSDATTTTNTDDTDSDSGTPSIYRDKSVSDGDASTVNGDDTNLSDVSSDSKPTIWEFLTKQAHANAGGRDIPHDIDEAVKQIYWPYVKKRVVDAFCLVEAVKDDEIGDTIGEKVDSLHSKYDDMEEREAIEKAIHARKHAIKEEIRETAKDLDFEDIDVGITEHDV